MIRDLKSNLTVRNALSASTIATDTTTNGVAIDMLGYNSGAMLLRVGTYTDGTYTLGIEESDASGSGFADIDSGSIVGTPVALDSANECDCIGFVTTKRYVRLTVTSASTTSGADITGSVILGNPHQAPVPTHDQNG